MLYLYKIDDIVGFYCLFYYVDNTYILHDTYISIMAFANYHSKFITFLWMMQFGGIEKDKNY